MTSRDQFTYGTLKSEYLINAGHISGLFFSSLNYVSQFTCEKINGHDCGQYMAELLISV